MFGQLGSHGPLQARLDPADMPGTFLSTRGDDRCTRDHGVCRVRGSARDGSMVALGKDAECEQKATSNAAHNSSLGLGKVLRNFRSGIPGRHLLYTQSPPQ
jgi:hypothetical protein